MEHSELMTFDAFITHWSKERSDQIALSEDDRIWTYAQIDDRTARVVSVLTSMGLCKGDRIVWIGKNSDLYFTLFYGAARLGIVMVPVGWRLAPAEWAYIIKDTDAKAVFCGDGFDDVPSAVETHIRADIDFVTASKACDDITRAIRTDFIPSGPGDAVLQLYTSGTTGNPKGAVLSNRNLFALRLNKRDGSVPYLELDDDDVILIAMPCAHIGGTGLGIMALASGIQGHILSEFTPDGFFDAVETNGVTRLFIVPAALQMLINHPRCSSVDYSNLRYILYGAAPIPLELLRQCISMFGSQFVQVYGMTETTGTIIILPPQDHDPAGNARMRSAGIALPGVELKIADEDGNELPIGEVGELMTRSSNNMIGYWKLPSETQSTMSEEGWIRTGDAAYMDADRYVFIHDRVKDMIISGGENVYPAQVESAIYGHPDILEVAVIGIPDALWGEAVKAVCVAKPGHQIDTESVITWTRERLAGFKVPKSVDIVSCLPRNASGKILRKDLRAPYWQGYDRQVN
jgi:acyl-CoA synthetase (AMP-forming)/AMP-acid ligase II